MRKLIGAHKRVALDTSIWIYHFEARPDYLPLTTKILNAVSRGKCEAIVSELCLLEILVRPLQLGLDDVADEYETLLTHFPYVQLVAMSRSVLLEAAALRAYHRIRTPDAIILATAITSGATRIITNDKRWKKVEEIDVVCLSDLL
jgi:predicted nucleic acid-binding protein